MAGKINVYNLGQLGVDVVKSPIHLDDGAFLSAQNAQIDSVRGVGGIRKRDGITKVNSSPLAGALRGLIALPLPDLSARVRTFYLALNAQSLTNTFKSSTDGTTFVNGTSPSRAAAEHAVIEVGGPAAGEQVYASFLGKLWYPGTFTPGTDQPPLRVFDGTNDLLVLRIPDPPNGSGAKAQGIGAIVPYSDYQLILSVFDDNRGTGTGRLFLFDALTGLTTQLGQESNITSGYFYNALTVWQGRIWAAGKNNAGATACKVYWVRPGDATLTLDFTSATNIGYCLGFAVFKGELYAGFAADTPSNAVIKKRTNSGAWSTVLTGDGTGALNYLGPLIVNQAGTKIFAFWSSGNGAAPKVRIVESTDGASWTTSYSISANLSDSYSASGAPLLDTNGDIYWPLASASTGNVGGLLKRTSAGTWSIVLSAVTSIQGPLGYTLI